MSNDWRTGLFSCMSHTSSCFDNCCCYPCQTSRQWIAANEKTTDTCSILHCVIAVGCVMAYSCMIRRKLAANYSLDEGFIGACFKGCICFPCSLCQTWRELSLQGTWPGGSCLNNEPLTKL